MGGTPPTSTCPAPGARPAAGQEQEYVSKRLRAGVPLRPSGRVRTTREVEALLRTSAGAGGSVLRSHNRVAAVKSYSPVRLSGDS